MISLRFAWVAGTEPAAAPLFLLAGGPGQSAAEQAAALLPTLRSIHKGDIVFLDQRGTGASNPLRCGGGFAMLRKEGAPLVRECIAALGQVADLRHYGTPEAVEDLEAVRKALGFKRINLFGVSYGTRVALAYMRRYPARVRASLLRAAAPPDFNIIVEGAANADLELSRTLTECEKDPVCATDFPQARQQISEIRRRLEREPQRLNATGNGEPVVVTPELFNSALYVMLLTSPGRQQLPRLISTITSHGFEPISPMLSQINAVYASIPVGMYLSVICSEDAPRIPANMAARQLEGMSASVPNLAEHCALWPRKKVADSFFAPLRVKVPTLILSGAVDPSTTVAAAGRVIATLPVALHVIVPATSHAPPIPKCTEATVAAFLATASLKNLAPDCSAAVLPPFARPASPPAR